MKATRNPPAACGFTIVESLLMIAVVLIFSGILYSAIKKDYLTPKQEAKAPAATAPAAPAPSPAPAAAAPVAPETTPKKP